MLILKNIKIINIEILRRGKDGYFNSVIASLKSSKVPSARKFKIS